MNYSAKLCYVSNGRAYFTEKPLTEQTGDDWNDRPYEHNAGTPYDYAVMLIFDGPFIEPCEGHVNSPWCVDDINAGAVAWLRTESWVKERLVIPAGTTVREFIKKVQGAGGTVYAPLLPIEKEA